MTIMCFRSILFLDTLDLYFNFIGISGMVNFYCQFDAIVSCNLLGCGDLLQSSKGSGLFASCAFYSYLKC